MAFDPHALVGTTIADKYEVQAVVGEGGFAVVYRALHKVWERLVAIKVFRTLGDLPPDRRAQLVKSFIQEGALLGELSERSAAFCQARDVGMLDMHDGREMPYLVLEWLEGRSLDRVLDDERDARMPPRTLVEAVHLVEPAAAALALAHRRGIAHRDVKPANLFILGDPRGEFTVKVLDFGIAKVVQDAHSMAGSFAKTQGVMSSFTPAYGAPEQFARSYGATGPWTDVFATALIFTELVTGAPALRGDDLAQLGFCAMDPNTRPTPRRYGASIPDAVEAVLLRALAIAPNDRYASMGDFWDALRSALAMGPMPGLTQTDPRRSSSPDGGALGPRIVASSQPTDPTPPPPPDPGASARGGTAPLVRPQAPPAAGPSAPQAFQLTPSALPGGAPAPSTGRLYLAVGGAVVAATLLAAVAVYAFAIRGHDPAMAAGSASAAPPPSAVTTAASAATPPPSCPDGMTRIPEGKFFMGSDDKTDRDDERPAHQVTLPAYCIDTHEVTVAEYKKCSDRGECKRAPQENDWKGITAKDHATYDPLCNIREPEKKAAHPINCVDWELAGAYCRAVGKRLPTEAEWERATRGSDGRKYPWGDDAPGAGHLNACGTECLAWAKAHHVSDLSAMYDADDGFATTAPVGSFPKGASPYGVQDVVGNVWEWVSDWYGPYGSAPEVGPKGPASGDERVMRGGAWNGSDPAWVRPSFRFSSAPTLRSYGVGVRCAKDLVSRDE